MTVYKADNCLRIPFENLQLDKDTLYEVTKTAEFYFANFTHYYGYVDDICMYIWILWIYYTSSINMTYLEILEGSDTLRPFEVV